MDKEKLIKNIEDGLLEFYLEKDHSKSSDSDLTNVEEHYDGQMKKYARLSKQILFRAKAHIQKNRVTKVISIAEASGRLKSLKGKNKDNVFPIFKKHVEKYGLAANYRNFDKMTEEEMANILEQLDLTALFGEIDKNLVDD